MKQAEVRSQSVSIGLNETSGSEVSEVSTPIGVIPLIPNPGPETPHWPPLLRLARPLPAACLRYPALSRVFSANGRPPRPVTRCAEES